jgi:hypothetical protein
VKQRPRLHRSLARAQASQISFETFVNCDCEDLRLNVALSL